MRALIKTDFENWLQKQLVEDTIGFYLLVGAKKVYFFFEGQDGEVKDDAYAKIQIVPLDTTRPATGVKYHTGRYKFFIYALDALTPDKITDTLADIIEEKTIEETANFRIETELLVTRQRGNKLYGTSHYENIVDINFNHWSLG